MFIIEAVKNNLRWISGIFSKLPDVDEYLKEIPESLIPYQRVYEIPQNEYPIYIIESFGFKFVDKEELIRKIKCIVQTSDDETLYFNYYTINEDYRPKKAGTDYMGILKHRHVDNMFLKIFREQGSI